MSTKPFSYEISEDFDHVLDEKGNTYTAFRKIKWGDSEEFKPDIRKYYATEDGEKMAKGVVLSEEATHELVKVLLKEGYGDDKEIYETIIDNRPEITSRFIAETLHQDPEGLYAHLDAYPVPEEEEEEFVDIEEVI